MRDLLTHVVGTTLLFVVEDGETTPNPLLGPMVAANQVVIILLNASLSEEAIAVTIGLTTAHSIWLALERVYTNTYVERIHNLLDELRHLTRVFPLLQKLVAGLNTLVINL